MFASFWEHRSLIRRLLKREIQSRYRGSVLGLIWSFVTPLLMLLIYTFVFKYVFEARWQLPDNEGAEINFAMMLFLGLIIHGVIADILLRSPGLMVENVNFVKKVVFPLQVFGYVVLFSALFNFFIGFLLLLGFVYLELGAIPLTALLMPLVLLPYCLMVLGISWILSSLGVYLRDIQQITGTLATLLLFLSPVFYSIDILPDLLRQLILLNPISVIIEAARAVVIYGNLPAPMPILVYSLVSMLVAMLGYALFERSRRGFADVL